MTAPLHQAPDADERAEIVAALAATLPAMFLRTEWTADAIARNVAPTVARLIEDAVAEVRGEHDHPVEWDAMTAGRFADDCPGCAPYIRLRDALAERDALRERLAEVEALHSVAHWCADAEGHGDIFIEGDEGVAEWPCPTLRAALHPKETDR